MNEALQWAVSIGSAGLSALALGYGLLSRRALGARARRRGAAAAREAIFHYWRAAEKDIRELSARLEALEMLEARRYASPVLLKITDRGDGPDLAA